MTIYYVDFNAPGDNTGDSWEDAFTDLASALSVSVSGDQVWCKEAWCTLTAELEIPGGVSLYGGFQPGLTGTSGSVAGRRPKHYTHINGDDTYRCFVIAADTILIDGFSISDCDGTYGGAICILGGTASYYWGANILNDPDMEASGTSSWSTSNASVTKDTSPVYEGTQSLRVTASTTGGYAYQAAMTIGHTYRFSGWGYMNGAEAEYKILDGAVELDSGAGPHWTYLNNSTFVATSTDFKLAVYYGDSSAAWFDNFSLQEYTQGSSAVDDITIQNCKIQSCTATYGAGIYIDEATNVVVDNVTFTNNAATRGGGILLDNTGEHTVQITDCRFWSCSATYAGGAIRIGGANAGNTINIEKCFIQNCDSVRGGGIICSDYPGATQTISRCVITGNTSDQSDYGGGVRCYDGNVILVNCTIADNSPSGISTTSFGGTNTVTNCILWNNGTEIDTSLGGSVTVTYSDVEGGYAGTGNVNDDPLFYGGSDVYTYYALNGLSDAVDSGNSGATGYLSTDIRGASMYDHPDQTNTGTGSPAYSDMGAFEFQGTPINTWPMSSYFINCSLATTADDSLYTLYAIVRLPEMPSMFADIGSVTSLKLGISDMIHVRHKVSSEIEIDETDSTLSEWVSLDDSLCAQRYTPLGTNYTSPTRAADYDDDTKSDDDDHVAEDRNHPSGREHTYPGLEKYQKYAIIKMDWQPYVEDQYDVLYIYNVDIEQIHDNEYTYSNFCSSVHPATTLIAPDMPLSAWHIQRVLQDSLLKMLYEAVNKFSIPVFGVYKQPVV